MKNKIDWEIWGPIAFTLALTIVMMVVSKFIN